MKKRIEVATDVAMIGAWDAGLNDSALAGAWGRKQNEILERDAVEGRLFFMGTGADWGGAIDVYVDEEAPEEIRKRLKQVGEGFLLSLLSGRLVIDGVEFYRTGKEKESVARNATEIPAGNYALSCYVSKAEGGINPPSRADLDKMVGAKAGAYYRRIQWAVLAMYVVVPVLFFVVRHFHGWKVGLLSAVAVAVMSFLVVKMLAASARFKRAAQAERELWQRAQAAQEAMFVFELRRRKQGEELKGGWVDVSN